MMAMNSLHQIKDPAMHDIHCGLNIDLVQGLVPAQTRDSQKVFSVAARRDHGLYDVHHPHYLGQYQQAVCFLKNCATAIKFSPETGLDVNTGVIASQPTEEELGEMHHPRWLDTTRKSGAQSR